MNHAAGWVSTDDSLPPDETPVLVVLNGEVRIGELCWEEPSWEETFSAFRYWDDPHEGGQEWDWYQVTHWQHLPDLPTNSN